MMITCRASQLASRLPIPAKARRLASCALVACSLLAVGAVGCSKSGDDRVSVAQVAVRANPDLELVATDAQQGVLTVRVRQTGQVLTVRVDDVIAGTAFRDLAAAPSAAAAPAAAAGPVANPSAPVAGVRPPAAGGAAQEAPAAAKAANAQAEPPATNASTQMADARERLRGAGRRLGSTTPQAAPQGAPTVAEPRDATARRRQSTPVLCSGNQTVRLEHVLLDVDAVAVSANGGCRVSITDSRIMGRVGVAVNGKASVTIERSEVVGVVAFQVSGDGEVSVQSSTIEGSVQSRLKSGVRDLGQNVWR